MNSSVELNQDGPVLSWALSDIEQRLGFAAGKYTRVNNFLSFLSGATLTVAFYGTITLIGQSSFADMFTKRGPTPYVISLLFFWSLAILFLKWRKLRLQRQSLGIKVVPDDHDFVLSPSTVQSVLDRVYLSVDNPVRFSLFNRIIVALSNLKNIGRVSDVDDILRSQAEHEESSMETSYALLRGFIWAIPVLGFIGTVMGLSQAIGGFGGVLGQTNDIQEITSALQIVTGGLSTAFETTLVGLVAALILQMCVTFLKKWEEDFLDACADYCLRNIVGRLRIMPYQQEGE